MTNETVMANLEQELVNPEISKFAPLKIRGQSLESIKGSIRKTISDLDVHIRELDDYLTGLKQMRDQMQRSLG